MKLNDLEWTAERLANNSLFGEKETEALKCFRNLVATLRAACDLPSNFDSKDIDQLIWKQVEEIRVLKASLNKAEEGKNAH